MKSETFQTLITARTLLEQAHGLCLTENKYASSAGLVILQDGLELVLLACLLELGADEEKALENLTFDQMIGELKKKGKKVIKSGTLTALNKERVIIKHYGQLADPATVRRYWDAAKSAMDELLVDVVGKTLPEILLHELINVGPTKTHVEEACKFFERHQYYEALVEVRKALFLEVEREYMIEDWKDFESGTPLGLMDLIKGGRKAPYFTKNRAWIEENVSEPFDYVYLDDEALRLNLLEWGASPQDFYNLLRLTPRVVLLHDDNWATELHACCFVQSVTPQVVQYCLDRVVALIISKQQNEARLRSLGEKHKERFKVRVIHNAPVHRKAASNSEVRTTLLPGEVFEATGYIPSISGQEMFFRAWDLERDLFGYVPIKQCKPIQEV